MDVKGRITTREDRHPYVLFDYDGSGNLIYMGEHRLPGAATTDDGWKVTKFTIAANGITVIEELIGIYEDRATLGWA
jgi:hypothetical protein